MTITELKVYILENNLLPKILEDLGCHHIAEHGSYISAANPDGDNTNAINCYTDNNFINVVNYTRDLKPRADIVDLVQFLKGCGFTEALKWLSKSAGVRFSYYGTPKKKKEGPDPFDRLRKLKSIRYDIADVRPLDESVLGEFTDIEWAGLFREGVTPRTCSKFGVMYSYKWRRIIYPHRYALDGKLVAYNARTTVENYEEFGIPKYFATEGYRKSDNVYGLWENRKSIEKADCCIVVESEKSVLKRHSLFDERFCAVSGHSISEEQKRILIGLNVSEIVISFDNDVPEEQVWHSCEKLYYFKKVSYTKDKNGWLGPKDSIADLPDKKCRQMITNRIMYDETTHEKYKDIMRKKARKYETNRRAT